VIATYNTRLKSASMEWLPIVGGLLVLYVPTFYDLSRNLWQRDDLAHAPIILGILLWLIWDQRQALLAMPTRSAPGAGFALLTLGLLLYVVGRSQSVMLFEVGSIALILPGVLLAMRGWPALRAMWFMLLFSVYLIPIPGFLLDMLTLPLKKGVSEIAERILYAAGYPVAREGVVLTIGQYQLLVADACSGLNSMFSLSALGLLYLYLMRHKSWLHNSLIVASLLPIAFFANVVRVIILMLITYHFGDATGQGFLHGFSGLVLFTIALIIIIMLDAALKSMIGPPKPLR